MGYQVSLQDALLEHLAQVGFDPVYGARPLKRAIQHQVENPLAQAILSGKVLPGKPLELSIADDKLSLNRITSYNVCYTKLLRLSG